MKKYLMTGLAALAMTAAMTSCSHDDELYQPATNQEAFKTQFIAQFGNIDPNQNWGFTAKTPVNLSETRAHFANINEYRSVYGTVPPNVTWTEHDLVLAEFSKQRLNAVNTVNVNWSDFFVFQVHQGTAEYTAGNGGKVIGGQHMDELKCYAGGKMGDPGVAVEHINNFNNSTNNTEVDEITGAMVMVNSGTADFSYKNSEDSKDHNEYIIIAGADIDPSLAGFYYVGFDFFGNGNNPNMQIARDYIFNDWIVRISPAIHESADRIIAEDLMATQGSDFDYNDVVFDVWLSNEWVASANANKLVAHITLQAAGGTMPLYIGGVTNGKEVHELFGVDTSVMVNTNEGTVSKAPVSFTLVLRDALQWNETYNSKDIPVDVQGPDGLITLVTETGQAPEKICVETRYNWCNEREKVYVRYPDFTKWVGDHTVRWY